MTLGLNHERGRLVLLDDDIDLIRNAICTTGLGRVDTKILDAVRKADPRLFMALLLANLPNLTTLYADLPDKKQPRMRKIGTAHLEISAKPISAVPKLTT